MKKDTIILDHGNVIEEHGLLDWPIEWTLDGKKRAWKKPSRERTEKLVKCRACHNVFMGAKECPLCGTPVMSFGKKIATIEAELEEIGSKIEKTMAEKRMWYGMLKTYQRRKGYQDGWVEWSFKDRFGTWPKGLKYTFPVEPNTEFLNWIRHMNIKKAKAREKEAKYAQGRL